MLHNEFKADAYLTLSNTGGIEIMLNRSNDGVYYRFNYGQDNLQDEEIYESEIFYGYSDEDTVNDATFPYFIHESENEDRKYFLNEFIRTNY